MHTAALWHHWIGAGDRAGAHPVGALVGPAVGTFVGALLGAFVGVFVVAAAQDEEEEDVGAALDGLDVGLDVGAALDGLDVGLGVVHEPQAQEDEEDAAEVGALV